MLKEQDVKTFESYKKAMRAAAGQIRDGTKFCIFNDVQIPDATGKMRPVKTFLVVGSPLGVVKPLLAHLKGARKPLCEGTCSLEEGKVALKGQKVPFGAMKAQATFFKDLLGKPVTIPAGAKDEDEEEEQEVEGKAPAAVTAVPAPPPMPASPLGPKPPVTNLAASTLNPPLPPPPMPAGPPIPKPPLTNLPGSTLKPPPPPPMPAGPPIPKPPLTNLPGSTLKPPPPPMPPSAGKPPAPPAPPAPSAHEPHPVRLAKASVAWHGTRSIVDGQCNQLKAAIRTHYGKSHPAVMKEIDSNMHKIDAIVGQLDHKLADSLKKASSAANDAARVAELRVAREILNSYIRYVNTEPLIAHIDQNPFGVKCNLRQVLASSLKEMTQSLVA
jgi:hypothetical protein